MSWCLFATSTTHTMMTFAVLPAYQVSICSYVVTEQTTEGEMWW